jgi:hypothetical protein
LGKLLEFKRDKKKQEEKNTPSIKQEEVLNLDEFFERIQEINRQIKENVEKERQLQNKATKRRYNIKDKE